MEFGLGLPTTVLDKDGPALTAWARRAEEAGFASLGVIDRLVYDNFEPLTSLAAAAAVTERVRLTTGILIAPYRTQTALLAKQAATVSALSGGRLVLGVAAGGREDDFRAVDAAYHDRGRRLDGQLAELRDIWQGKGPVPGIGPRLAEGQPPLLVGGHSPAAMQRAARFGDGWFCGGSSASGYGELVARVHRAWQDAGRTDRPRLVALAYAALGPDALQTAQEYLGDYYSFAGPVAQRIASMALTDRRALVDLAQGYAESGCDELILMPCSADPGQLEALAEAVL
ncbi:LLM class flavin-dependent oxidoreductase [Streptomyces morookaense]|uniref:LLM class flavin-dependent oxidoreductase n=1 Tax=Streptomyces morookaense TaxID=1970 RepID=A0A7Y7B1Z1_STRMO|nr:LLM class flavin-dependent oxidoreductase [Streptomyces morookaense]NVK77509.1 LLM class flavin-dependent oxidoreductase [Streptomyces morookaense]GHF22169.1 monooxygenase [Streptomyces morookaense]